MEQRPRSDIVVRQASNARPLEGSKTHESDVVEDQLAFDARGHGAAVLLELHVSTTRASEKPTGGVIAEIPRQQSAYEPSENVTSQEL
jgi:hypothetical protein